LNTNLKISEFSEKSVMSSIAIVGPVGSDCYQAACRYNPDAEYVHCNRITEALQTFVDGQTDYALIPVYNTREGEVKEYFRFALKMKHGVWIDNVVLPIHLAMGALSPAGTNRSLIKNIIGRGSVLKQCEEYIETNFPQTVLTAVQDIEASLQAVDRKSTRLNSSHNSESRMPSSA
jgi:prephenate dehydratase